MRIFLRRWRQATLKSRRQSTTCRPFSRRRAHSARTAAWEYPMSDCRKPRRGTRAGRGSLRQSSGQRTGSVAVTSGPRRRANCHKICFTMIFHPRSLRTTYSLEPGRAPQSNKRSVGSMSCLPLKISRCLS